MKCKAIKPLLLADPAHALSAGQQAAVAAHLAGCGACRQLQENLTANLAAWRSDVAHVSVPDAEVAWKALQSQLHPPASRRRRRLAPLLWIGAPLAAAAAVALVFFHAAPSGTAPAGIKSPVNASAEFVEPGNASASTVVYVDKESGWLVVWAADTASNGKG